jgi:hypothetical protein
LHLRFVPHIYSVGYSIFLLPVIAALGTTDWTVVTRYVVEIQAFVLVPLTWVLLLSIIIHSGFCRNRWRVLFGLLMALFLLYEVLILARSRDGVVFNLFFGLIIAYAPQLLYNYRAYHTLVASGYNWNWHNVAPRYAAVIKQLYGSEVPALFSVRYLMVNMTVLFKNYIHYVLLALINIYVLMRERSGGRGMNGMDVAFLTGNCCSLVYIALYLSYWWSQPADPIDRFLMPLLYFGLINLCYSIRITADAKVEGA